MIDPEILAAATRCYVTGCDRENELVVHLRDDPWGGADLCLEHAKEMMDYSGFCFTCDCPFCERARAVLYPDSRQMPSPAQLVELPRCGHTVGTPLCPECHQGAGEWVVATASGSRYLVDLKDAEQAWVTRLPDPDPEAIHSPQMRLDSARIRLLQAEAVMPGEEWVQVLDLRGDGITTIRETSPVVEVVRLER